MDVGDWKFHHPRATEKKETPSTKALYLCSLAASFSSLPLLLLGPALLPLPEPFSFALLANLYAGAALASLMTSSYSSNLVSSTTCLVTLAVFLALHLEPILPLVFPHFLPAAYFIQGGLLAVTVPHWVSCYTHYIQLEALNPLPNRQITPMGRSSPPIRWSASRGPPMAAAGMAMLALLALGDGEGHHLRAAEDNATT